MKYSVREERGEEGGEGQEEEGARRVPGGSQKDTHTGMKSQCVCKTVNLILHFPHQLFFP